MSAKSAMYERFKNKDGFKIMEVPKSMRPTQESLEKLDHRISAMIRNNDAMRLRSKHNANRPCC